jgi:anthranilate/para-aminobenzoate synthase component I
MPEHDLTHNKLAENKTFFLFETQHREGAAQLLFENPEFEFVVYPNRNILRHNNSEEKLDDDPFIAWQQAETHAKAQGLPFSAGWVAYEFSEHTENLALNRNHYDYPLLYWAYFTAVSQGSCGNNDISPFAFDLNLQSVETKETYASKIASIKDSIRLGNVYEVNLSHKFTSRKEPGFNQRLQLFRKLRFTTPGEYAAFIHTDMADIISTSPELFIHWEDGTIQSKPIKGTRPRGQTTDADNILTTALRQSEKDRAENLMIVDLMRNDLSKICEPGSVAVNPLFAVEKTTVVQHLVSTVWGKTLPGVHKGDIIKATFPPGSMTGAPKHSVLQHIQQLEPQDRGIYSGVIGYSHGPNHLVLSVVIRTLVRHSKGIEYQVGGAITIDSDPEAEYEETLVKASGIRKALGDI